MTDILCTCGYLERAADDPATPIVFDEQSSEYQFTYQESGLDGPSMLVIYHCPFYGGRLLNHSVTYCSPQFSPAEKERLIQLVVPIETIQQALDTFGTPHLETYSVLQELRRDDPSNPPSFQQNRELLYTTLSEVADVRITEVPNDRVSWTLCANYIDA